MELLVGALAVIALIAIVIRFAPRNASGGVVLPGVIDDSIGMWGIRAVTRRMGRGRNDVNDERLDGIPLDILEARLGPGQPADVVTPSLGPAPALAAARAGATVPARSTRPPSVVQTSTDPEPADLPAESDNPPPDGEIAVGPESNGTAPGGNGSNGKRPGRRKRSTEPVVEEASAPSHPELPAGAATVEAGLAAAVTATGEPGQTDPSLPAATSAHAAASTNGTAPPGVTGGQAATNGAAGTIRSATEASAAVNPSFAEFERTVPLVVGSRPIGTWSKSPDSLPNRYWGSTPSPAQSTGAAAPRSAVVPTSAVATSRAEPGESASDDPDGWPTVPLPAVVQRASTRLPFSIRSMAIAIGAVLLVVALVLAAQVDKRHEAVLSATGLPGDGVAGAGRASPAAESAAPSEPARSGAPGKSSRPTAVPSPAGPSGAPPPTGMPAFSRSALVQAILLDQRLTVDRAALRTALAASPFDASAVAAILRSISADCVNGLQWAPIIASWQPSEQLGADLRDAYDAIHQEASDALAQSVQLTSAYRQSAKAMVSQLAALKAVDDRARALAEANGAGDPGTSAAP